MFIKICCWRGYIWIFLILGIFLLSYASFNHKYSPKFMSACNGLKINLTVSQDTQRIVRKAIILKFSHAYSVCHTFPLLTYIWSKFHQFCLNCSLKIKKVLSYIIVTNVESFYFATESLNVQFCYPSNIQNITTKH